MKATFSLVFFVFHLFYNPIDSGATQLDSGSIDEAIKNHAFVFINFYADWCRFSNMLAPIWDEFADKTREKFGGDSDKRILIGKIDCDKEGSLGSRFHISKYPTLKYVRNGKLAKKEFRGKRSVESFIKFVEDQIQEPIKEIRNLDELGDADPKKRHIIGYFEDDKSLGFDNFKKVALELREECQFSAGFGEVVKHMHPPGQSIVAFRPDRATSNEKDQTFEGALYNYDELRQWCEEMCTPLVRVITFENAEELTDEGLPFLILFHHPDDKESVKEFKDAVRSQIYDEKPFNNDGNLKKVRVNFLVADGLVFAHPLHHLGKTKEDLPIIAIDSFRHMYVFKNYNDIRTPGKLQAFLQDLYSGKLHREFHYGPDQPESSPDPPQVDDQPQVDGQPPAPIKMDPPPSQFQHLQPSKNRYTILRDEF